MGISIEIVQTKGSRPRPTHRLLPLLPPPKKMNAKELYAHIQSLTAQMDDDEKERFYDEAEKEGF